MHQLFSFRVQSEAEIDESPSFNNKRAPSSPAFVCGLVGTFITMLAIVLLLYVYEKPPVQQVTTSTFCCPRVLKEILGAANPTIDPCRSFFDHTCYAYVPIQGGYTQRPPLNTDPVDGFPTTEAGRAVAAYHRSCMSLAEAETTAHGRLAADGLLNVTSPPKSSFTSHHLVSLIIELSLKYGLPALLRFDLKMGGNSTVLLKISPAPLEFLPEAPSPNTVSELKADAFEVVKEYFSLKLSLQEVDAFLDKVTDSMTNATETYTLDSLGDIHSELTALHWKEMLGAFEIPDRVNVQGVPLKELKDKFAHILQPGQRVLTLVSALVSASVRLASRLVVHDSTSEDRRRECRKRANELLPFRVLDRISHFRSKSQDHAILEAFKIIGGAVLTRAKSGMTSDDFRRLETTLSGMRVALPSQVIPEDLAIPTMTSNYARAELAARAYVRRAQRHQMISLGVSEGFSRHFLQKNGSFTEGVLVVPTHVYTALPPVNATDPLLHASTVGVYIADALWNFVFSNDWGPLSNAALREYGICIQDNSRSLIEWPSEIMWLSLATSIDAARDSHWGSLVRPADAWEVTRGQLFFMSFVHYLLCRDPSSRLETFGWDVNIFLSAFEDFSARSAATSRSRRSQAQCALFGLGTIRANEFSREFYIERNLCMRVVSDAHCFFGKTG
ncbi:hypothetical protein HPB48_017609 [Haemaphysalis longicornis]|uniref:Uncharacterized protein n=1 Tax=Haemaphysalis longicornis TaxID=44386 RepID=A0A9J6H123_HAELO|nr:hypothetical protein HPB48_017609 [Haemaphysalis longicornis]